MKKYLVSLMTGVAVLASSQAHAKNDGVSVYGEEAREVYNALVALGASRIDTEQGPEVAVDLVDCLQGSQGSACAFKGDPQLSTANGSGAERLVKSLIGVGVKTKAADANTQSLSVASLNCGILHYPNGNSVQEVHTTEMPSCYLQDNNAN